jgi:hypothetical protein
LATALPTVYHIDTGGKFSFTRQDLYLQHGITDDVGLGLWTYYIDQRIDYSANLRQDANWALLSGTEQAALSGAVGAADTMDSGSAALADTVLGYQQRLVGVNESPIRFAYLLGVRLPTGHVADPRNPGDLSTGDGQTDIGLWLSFDWEPAPNWLLNLHSRHEYQMPGQRDVLDPADANNTLSQKFQPGFYNYLEVKGRRHIPGARFNTDLELTAIYETSSEARSQQYDAATGSYRGALHTIDGSGSNFLLLEAQAGIDLFPSELPVAVMLYYAMPLQGKNALALEYAGVRIDVYW